MKGRERVMAIATIGIDLGKNSCSLAGLDASGRGGAAPSPVAGQARRVPGPAAGRAWWRWRHVAARIISGGLFGAQGHEVRLMSPEYVQPYVKAQKNDDRDAEAIAEAATRPTMRFVALKSEAQLDQQTLHRARSRLVNGRTRLINQLRAILLERGDHGGEGPTGARPCARDRCSDAEGSGLSPRMQDADRRDALANGPSSTPASQRSIASSSRRRAQFGAGAAAGDDPRHRRAERHGAGGGGRRGGRTSRTAATWPPGSAWCRAR